MVGDGEYGGQKLYINLLGGGANFGESSRAKGFVWRLVFYNLASELEIYPSSRYVHTFQMALTAPLTAAPSITHVALRQTCSARDILT